MDSEEMEEEAAAEAYRSGKGEGGDDVSEDEPDLRPQGRPAALKAGEIDDNERFDEYLDYLESYRGQSVREIDVSERYLITVLNGTQTPLLDAHVRIYNGEEEVFEGHTYAGGATIFLPHAWDVSENASELRLVAEHGSNRTEMNFERGEQETLEVIIEDATPTDELRLDMLFLLDTTGSMADELNRIQETIDSIAQRIDDFTPRPTLRFSAVAYRDRGDDYVTRTYDFTSDVSIFRKQLNSISAGGGGDSPESLNEGLHEAIQGVKWEKDAVRLVFLVADAGPHLDYEQDYDYAEEALHAVRGGIKIYPIAASNSDPFAEYVFRQLAQQTLARFIFLTYQPGQASGVPGESTTLEAGEQPYTVERLDDLIVQIVQRELAAASGNQ